MGHGKQKIFSLQVTDDAELIVYRITEYSSNSFPLRDSYIWVIEAKGSNWEESVLRMESIEETLSSAMNAVISYRLQLAFSELDYRIDELESKIRRL